MAAERHVMVAVRGNPEALRRAVLAPGGAVRVGRGERAGLVVPEDDKLSALHFELAWDGARCTLRDLGSAQGTLLHGVATREADIGSGAWIRAGSTDLSVYFEDETPAPRRAPEPAASKAARETALGSLREVAAGGGLFAILDAARSRRVPVLLRESIDDYDCLYQGVTAETMADYAPYLVHLRAHSRLLPRLVDEGFGDSWGVFLEARAPLREVRAHFRRLLFVKNEETDEMVYFRFYDPRVLRIFVPTCSVRQEDELFGPVTRFLCEDEEARVVTFSRGRR
jgi:hypothetical protein